jgi:uncharacterized protein (TIGR02246 family)
MSDPKLRRRTVLAAGMATLSLAAAGGGAHAQAGPSTPAELVRQFQAAMAARDADRISALYADQAIMMAPSGGVVSGRARIRETLARNIAGGQPGLRLVNARFDGGADVGVVLWTWDTEVPPAAPAAQRQRIRSMLYVKNSPSGWQIVADMFQVFSPPPG